MAGREINIFVQETWLVNTPTLILNSGLVLVALTHPLIPEMKNRVQLLFLLQLILKRTLY